MKEISHKIVHQYQPTPTSCSPTSLSMLLEHYDVRITPQEIERVVPQAKDKDGNDSGTVTQLLAAWAAGENFNVEFYTFDCQIIDQSWHNLQSKEITVRLETGLNGWVVPGLGEEWSRAYRQAYIDLLKTSCKLIIQPSVTTDLIYNLLREGPLFVNVCVNTLYGKGRTNDDRPDDINGRTWNHSIVAYGNDAQGNLLIADPMVAPGLHTIKPERLIAAISTAQIECDNLLFQLKSR